MTLGRSSPGTSQLARGAASTEGEHHEPGEVDALRGAQGEHPSVPADLQDLLAEAKLQVEAAGEVQEDLEQVFLLVLGFLHPAPERHVHRLHEHQLAARVVEDRAPEVLLLLEGDVAELPLVGGGGGGDPRGAGPHDGHVEDVAARLPLGRSRPSGRCAR